MADFVLQNPQKAVDSNVSELAKQSGVSDATVVRMCHHIGYTGYYQFRISLARDLGKKQYGSSALAESRDAVEKLFQEYAQTMLAIGSRIDADVMWNCVNLLKTCKEAHIMAVGNTSPLAQYMGFRLGRLGIKSTYNVAAEYFMNHVNLADEDDLLIAISQPGTDVYKRQALWEDSCAPIYKAGILRKPGALPARYPPMESLRRAPAPACRIFRQYWIM